MFPLLFFLFVFNMKIYTIQLAKWRKAKTLGIPHLDTTSKSGVEELAPGWAIVFPYKNNEIDDKEYERLYNIRLDMLSQRHQEYWESLIKQETVCLACYCRAGFFCHRHLLAKYIKRYAEQRGVECTIENEIV